MSYYSSGCPDVDYNFKLNYTASNEWEKEFNENYSTANAVSSNTTVYGSIRESDDNDWYKAEISKAGYISLNFQHAYVETSEKRWAAYLYDTDKNELVRYNYKGNVTSTQGGNIGVPAGTYYIKIVSYYSSGCPDVDYNFKLNYTASNEWETEFNETYTTANPIALNTTIYGSIRTQDDSDWYKIEISETGYKFLSFYHTYVDTSEKCWAIYLYNSNFNEIQKLSYQGNITNVDCDLGELNAGMYYMKICPYYSSLHSDADYSLKIGTHIHNYNNVVTKATTSRNGKVVKRCSCGAVDGTTTIYYPKNVSLSTTTYTYNGKTKKPSVTVKDSNGRKISSSNYTVVYSSGRKNVGKYKVTVKFKGNYSGNVTKTFKIIPKTAAISRVKAISKGFEVAWKKQTKQITGYQVQYSSNKNFRYNCTTERAPQKAIAMMIENLGVRKKYYIRVRTYKKAAGINYYSKWSPAKAVTTKK